MVLTFGLPSQYFRYICWGRNEHILISLFIFLHIDIQRLGLTDDNDDDHENKGQVGNHEDDDDDDHVDSDDNHDDDSYDETHNAVFRAIS